MKKVNLVLVIILT